MRPLRKARAKALGAARSRGLELRRIPKVFVDNPEAELKVTLEHLVAHRMMEGDSDFFVVQVGAFDGKTDDPIHNWITRYGWSGVLIEPQARYFNELRQTYEGFAKLSLRNVALSHESGRRLYTVQADTPGVPEWVGTLASFDRSTIVGHQHLVPNLEELIRAEDVECVTFEDLLEGVERVDLLQVDAEGYDAEIVRIRVVQRAKVVSGPLAAARSQRPRTIVKRRSMSIVGPMRLAPYRLARNTYQRTLNRNYWHERAAIRQFYGQFIGRGDLVFDIGAFDGRLSEAFAELGATVVAVEPNPSLAADIRRHYGTFFTVRECAVGAEPGTGTLHFGETLGLCRRCRTSGARSAARAWATPGSAGTARSRSR